MGQLPSIDFFTVAALIGTVAAAIALLHFSLEDFSTKATAPIPSQVDQIRHKDTNGNTYAVVRVLTEPFHTTISYFFVRRPMTGSSSDQLAIYDNNSGVLEQRLRYRPEVTASDAPGSGAYLFAYQKVTDILGNGERELFGEYFPKSRVAGESYELPIVVAYDDATGGYALSPLLPAIAPPPRVAVESVFNRSYTFSDPGAYPPEASFGEPAVSTYSLLPGANPVVATATATMHGKFVLSLYQLTFRNGVPVSRPMCGKISPYDSYISASPALAVVQHLAGELSAVSTAHGRRCPWAQGRDRLPTGLTG